MCEGNGADGVQAEVGKLQRDADGDQRLSCGDEGCPQLGGREGVENEGCSEADEHGPQRDPGSGACQVIRARSSDDGVEEP